MEKKYFCALLPATNLETTLIKIQLNSPITIKIPPMAPLKYYSEAMTKKEFNINININSIPEFKTGKIIKRDNMWVVELPNEPFNSFDLDNYGIILGKSLNENWEPPETSGKTIRSWELGFFQLIEWCDEPFTSFEIKMLWKLKKLRAKG